MKNILILSIVIIAMVIIGVSFFSESNETIENSKTLYWNLVSEPETLDPQLNRTLDSGSVINHMFEGLFRNFEGKLIPAIATSYTVSSDQLTYTFKLRPANWSDGSALSAHDFEFAWKRALNPETASPYAYQLYYIKGGEAYHKGEGKASEVMVQALDDYTLEVVLESPTPYFLNLLSSFTFMPTKQSIVMSYPNGEWAHSPELSVSNGPYLLKSYTRGQNIILEKNPEYWNINAIKIDQISASFIIDETTQLTAFENNEVDIIDAIPLQEIPRLLMESNNLFTLPSLGTYFFLFNTQTEPFDNADVRLALSISIDRKAIVDLVSKGGEIPAYSMTPPGFYMNDGEDFNALFKDHPIDPSKANILEAQRLLAKAGYPDGKHFPEVEILFNTSESHKLLAEAIQQMWQDNLNIKVKLVSQEFAVFQENKSMGNFAIARGNWFADYPDPMTMLDIWTSNSKINTTGWKNSNYDQLIHLAKKSTGQQRIDLMLDAQRLLMKEAPILPLYYYSDLALISDRVVNWEKSCMGVWYFGNADIKEME